MSLSCPAVPRHCIISTLTSLAGMAVVYWKLKPTKTSKSLPLQQRDPHPTHHGGSKGTTSITDVLKHIQESLLEEESKLCDLESALLRAYDRSVNDKDNDEDGDGVGSVGVDTTATLTTTDSILTTWKDEYEYNPRNNNLSKDIEQLHFKLERLLTQVDAVTVFDSDMIQNLQQQKDQLSTWLVSVMGRCVQLRNVLEEEYYQSKIVEKQILFDNTVEDVKILSLMTALEDSLENKSSAERKQKSYDDSDGSSSWKKSYLAADDDDASFGGKRLVTTTKSHKNQLLGQYRRVPRRRVVQGAPPSFPVDGPGRYAISQFFAPSLSSQVPNHWLFKKSDSNDSKKNDGDEDKN